MSRAPQVLATFVIFSLSAGVLGGLIFYVDNAAPDVLGNFTEDTPFDMEVSITSSFYDQNTTSIYDVRSSMTSEAIVDDLEKVSFIDTYYEDEDYTDWRYENRIYIGVEESFFEEFPNAIETNADHSLLTDETCFVEQNTMDRLGLEIGDDYTAYVTYWSPDVGRVEYSETYEIVGAFDSNIFMDEYWWYSGQELISRLQMLTTTEGLASRFDELPYGEYSGIREAYWLNLDKAWILGEDPALLMEELDNLRKRIEQAALPYAYVSDYEILDAVRDYVAWATAMRAIAISFSIPSIVMGVMLVYYTSNLLADERRKDIGTLKTRGGSGWQAFKWIISSSLLTATIGSLGAIGTGAVAAYLSSAVKLFFIFDLTQLTGLEFLLYPQSLAIVFGFSFGVGILVSLPIAIKSFLMSSTEAHSTIEREILLEEEKMGSPWIDLVVIAISGYATLQTVMYTSMFSYYGLSVLGMLIVLVPFLAGFIVGFARLLSRPVASIKEKVLKRIKLDVFRVGSRVMSRTVALFKKSESMGVMFVAMVFAAGVFSSVSAYTGHNHMIETFKFQVGSDVTVDVKTGLNNVTTAVIGNISSVEGVSHVSAVLTVTGAVTYYTADQDNFRRWRNESITVYAAQPDSWYDAGFWLPYFTNSLPPQEALRLMSENYTNVLSSFRPVEEYSGYTPVYGDSITVRLKGDGWYNTSECSIVDIMADPGVYTSTTYLPGMPNTRQFVVMGLDYVHDCLNTTEVTRFLINLEDPSEYETVMDRLYELAPNSFSSIESPYSDINAAIESNAGQSIHGIYTMNVVFTLIFLSAGMFIVSLMRANNLSKQFSILRALGTEDRSITASVLVDTSIGLSIAAVIGAFLGFVLSGFIINMPIVYFGAETARLWARLPVTIVIPGLVLSGIIIASFSFSLIATYVVIRRTLDKNIAEDIQYME